MLLSGCVLSPEGGFRMHGMHGSLASPFMDELEGGEICCA